VLLKTVSSRRERLMRKRAFMLLVLASPWIQIAGADRQGTENAVIEGSVFDMNESVIPKATIIVEDTESNEATKLQTDDSGHYKISVKPGRYAVERRPIVGFVIPYEHSSFSISAGERVTINFRPRFPFSISDSIEGGHWIEKYETSGAHCSVELAVRGRPRTHWPDCFAGLLSE
jgi:protocatechuate 3,4-dioxygenase beta subunit